MKKLFISLFIACVLLLQISSCKKIIAAVFGGTDVNVPQVQVTVPTVIAVTSNEISLGSFSFYFNLDSVVKANTAGVFGANAVNSIKIKQISINITNADQLNNLANFKNARITLQSNTNNNPAEIFSSTFADTYASTYTYTPTNSPELISYLKGTNISYNVYGTIRRITNKPLTMVIAITLKAD